MHLGWLSLTQQINSDLSNENGFQMISVDNSTWKLEPTECAYAPDAGEGGGGGGGSYLKCTADISIISSEGLSELCTEPDALGRMGCLITVNVTDGAYNSLANDGAVSAGNLAGNQVTVQHRVYAGSHGVFDFPLLLRHRSLVVNVGVEDVEEGLHNGDAFGLITISDYNGVVSYDEWQGHSLSMTCENNILGLQEIESTSNVPDWELVVLRQEMLSPGVTTSIDVEFRVVDYYAVRKCVRRRMRWFRVRM